MNAIVGSIVALVTPMHEDGRIDFDGLRSLIDWHIDQGTDVIGVVGTTGESPTVTMEENREVIRVAVEHVKGRKPVLAGTGANATAEAIELSRFAKQVGADATLSVVPYYNKPSQEGIYQHFKAIAEAVDIPMMLYNVPGRTVADMAPETAIRCAALPGVFGIKEATGNIERAAWLIKHAPPGFSIYSGDDGTAREDVEAGHELRVRIPAQEEHFDAGRGVAHQHGGARGSDVLHGCAYRTCSRAPAGSGHLLDC